MSNTPTPLPDHILRELHIAEFAAGFVSPETKTFLLKIEPLLPSLVQDSKALIGDLVRLWPAIAPVFAALAAHVELGASVDDAVATVSGDTEAIVPPLPDRQGTDT